MKKLGLIIFCLLGLMVSSQTQSTIQIKDLVVVPQLDTTGVDTSGIAKNYFFTVKIDSISKVSKVYFKVGNANDLDNVYSLQGTVQETVGTDGLSMVYSVLYNGVASPFRNYATGFILPIQTLSGSYPLVVTFYIEDKLNRFSKKLYHLISE